MEVIGSQAEVENSPAHFSIRGYVSHVHEIDRKIEPLRPMRVSAFTRWQSKEKEKNSDPLNSGFIHSGTCSETNDDNPSHEAASMLLACSELAYREKSLEEKIAAARAPIHANRVEYEQAPQEKNIRRQMANVAIKNHLFIKGFEDDVAENVNRGTGITVDHVDTASESNEEPCSDSVETGSDSNGSSVVDPVDTGSVSIEDNVSDPVGPGTNGDGVVGAVETGSGSNGETVTNSVLTGSASNGDGETEYVESESGNRPLGIDLNLSPTHQEVYLPKRKFMQGQRSSEINAAKKIDFAIHVDDQSLSSLKMKGIMPGYKEGNSFLTNQQGETQAHLRGTESLLAQIYARKLQEKQILSDIGNKNCLPETTTKGGKGSNQLITEEGARRYEILRRIGESRLGKPDKTKSRTVQPITYVPRAHYKPHRASNGFQIPSSSSTQTQFSGMNHGHQNSMYLNNQEAPLSGTAPVLFAHNHPFQYTKENPFNASQLHLGSSSRACGDPNSLFMQNLARSEARIQYLTASSGLGDLYPRYSQTASWQNPPTPGWSPMIPNCFPYGMRNPNITNRNPQYLFPNGSAHLHANPLDNNKKNLDIGTSQRLFPSAEYSANTSRIGEMQLNLQAIGSNNLNHTGNMMELLRLVHAGACPSQPINLDNAAQKLSFPPFVAHQNKEDMPPLMHPPPSMFSNRNDGNLPSVPTSHPVGAAAPTVPDSDNGLCRLNLNPAELALAEYMSDPPGKKARRHR